LLNWPPRISRNGGLKCVRRSGAACTRTPAAAAVGGCCSALLQALLQLADTRLIAFLEILYFIADFLDFRVVCGDGRQGRGKGSADGGRQGELPEHEKLL
jgi:hypothetical protein